MRRSAYLLGSIGALGSASLLLAFSVIPYPPAHLDAVSDTRFGITLHDPYRWMENKNAPDVHTWVDAENRVAENYLNQWPGRNALEKRLKTLYDVDQINLPVPEGSRLFYTHRQLHHEKAAVYWRREGDPKEHLIFDPENVTSEGPMSLGEFYPSPDGRQLAYTLKRNNADVAVLHVRNVDTGRENENDTIPGADNTDLSWTPDSRGFYYTRLPTDAAISPAEREAYATVRFHALQSDSSNDPVVYPKTGDASVYLTPRVSRDGRWLFVSVIRGWTSNDIYVRDRQDRHGGFQPLFISTCATASVAAWKGVFYLTTNLNAPHERLVQIDPNHVDPSAWKPLVAERTDTVIESAHIIGQHLVLRTLTHVSSQIEVRSLNGEIVRSIDLPEKGTVRDISGRETGDTAYFEFESFFIPTRIYRLTVGSGASSLWAQTQVPVDPAPYTVDLVWFPSKDGTQISMFIVRRKDAPPGKPVPFQIIGYGGFQTPMLPQFNAAIYPWLEAGGAVAIPHLRGGGEYGESWHRAGMLRQKQHTFDDFIAAADYLIRNGYTRKDLLVTQGVSNGGLLVGAVLTQKPDLFRAVICKNPLLDMARYPLFGEGKAWVPEYGSPDVEQDFRALAAYSPYHHVRPGTRYPSVLLLSADNDDRVDPMHARKMAAALQAASDSANPILLKTFAQSGHAGADRIGLQVEESADRLGFLFQEVGPRHFRNGEILSEHP